MKLSDKKWSAALAGEFYLGLLLRPAARRFERELERDPGLRRQLQFWEDRFSPLLGSAVPEKAPREVWRNIESRIQPAAGGAGAASWWQKLSFWRPMALLSGALAVLLLGYFGYQRFMVDTHTMFAYMQDATVEPAFEFKIKMANGKMTVKPMKPPPISADQSLELWMLPAGNREPMSLGLINASGETHMEMNSEKMNILKSATGLAISLEPKGGSPTGQPTGPVMYQGKLQIL